MTPEELDQCFERFTTDVFRLETLQRYNVPAEEDRIRSWRDGRPRPERSVRTSPWLRRIAVSTAAGKSWRRVHLVDHPLSEYLRYEIVGYVESAAAGEEILLADRATHPDLSAMDLDYWMFDADGPHSFVVQMRYDRDDRWVGADYTEDPGVLARCRAQRDIALRYAVPLNVYLAENKEARNVA